jgi:hypothetical protein
VTYPINAFENEFKKSFKTCNNCRKPGKKAKRPMQSMVGEENDGDFEDEDEQHISVDDFLEEYAEAHSMLRQNEEDSQNSPVLDHTWIVSLPSSKIEKDLAEDICEWIQEIDDYHWM